MRLTALTPLLIDGVRVEAGDDFEADDDNAPKLISRKRAKAVTKKRKSKDDEPKE